MSLVPLVVDSVIRKATESEVKFSETDDPNMENQRKTYEWLIKTRELAMGKKYEIQTINDVAEYLETEPEHDSLICEFIKGSGYLKHYKCDTEINPYRYNYESFIKYFNDKGIDIEAAIRGELKKEPGMFVHIYKNYVWHVQEYEKSKLIYHKLHVDLYMNILLLIKQRLLVLYGSSKYISNLALETKILNMIDELDKKI